MSTQERACVAGRRVGWRRSRAAQTTLVLVDDVSAERPLDEFGAFAEQHRAHLLRTAVRLSRNMEIAKDLVQETLLRALRRFDRCQSHTHAATWLVTILTNLFFDQLRHQKVERKAEPELVVEEVVEDEDDGLASGVSDDELLVAVRALEPELRDVVELCYLKQMRYREVATVLKLPVGTIGTRLMRARARLRVLLANHEPETMEP